MTARLDPHITGIVQRRVARLRRRPAPRPRARFKSTSAPTDQQRLALMAARAGGTLTRGRHGHWTNAASENLTIDTKTIEACRRRGWFTDAPGYESAMKPSWTPVVITEAGRTAIGERE